VALADVVLSLSPEEATKYIARLVLQPLTAINQLLLPANQQQGQTLLIPPLEEIEPHAKYISAELFMISSLLRRCVEIRLSNNGNSSSVRALQGSKHPCIEILARAWGILERLVLVCRPIETVMDNICFVFKYLVRCSRDDASPYLPGVVNMIASSFTLYPHSCFLYLANVLVGEYGTAGQDFLPTLISLLHIFSNGTFNLLQVNTNFVSRPDVVEEFFEMMIRYLRRCPGLIYLPEEMALIPNPSIPANSPPSALLSSIFQCGLAGLITVHSKKTLESILVFYDQLLRTATGNSSTIGNNEGDEAGKHKKSHHNHGSKWLNSQQPQNTVVFLMELCKVLELYGQTLVRSLLLESITVLPISSLSLVGAVLKSLLDIHALRQRVAEWLFSVLNEIPINIISVGEKNQFITSFLRAEGKASLTEILRHFSRTYRTNNKSGITS